MARARARRFVVEQRVPGAPQCGWFIRDTATGNHIVLTRLDGFSSDGRRLFATTWWSRQKVDEMAKSLDAKNPPVPLETRKPPAQGAA